MREIIQFQVGGWGINISQKFWQKMIRDNIWNEEGEEIKEDDTFCHYKDIYFDNENKEKKFKPRSIIVDYDPEKTSEVQASEFGSVFDEDWIVTGLEGGMTTFAKTHYGKANLLSKFTFDVFRKQVEKCERVEAFQFATGLGGGTGSGLFCKVSINFWFKFSWIDGLICFIRY